MLVAPVVLLIAYRLAGGHLDFLETTVAFTAECLRVFVIVGAALLAAAWTRNLAQAATFGIALSLTSWAIDAAEGFAALAWLGGGSVWSIEHQLLPFGKGIVPIGACLWLSIAAFTSFLMACIGGSFARSSLLRWSSASRCYRRRRHGRAARVVALTIGRRNAAPRFPLQERLRNSSRRVDVYLDRDDSRRRHVESGVLRSLPWQGRTSSSELPSTLRPMCAKRGTMTPRADRGARRGGVRETRSPPPRDHDADLRGRRGRLAGMAQPPIPDFPW
jgi:hypothetical protein